MIERPARVAVGYRKGDRGTGGAEQLRSKRVSPVARSTDGREKRSNIRVVGEKRYLQGLRIGRVAVRELDERGVVAWRCRGNLTCRLQDAPTASEAQPDTVYLDALDPPTDRRRFNGVVPLLRTVYVSVVMAKPVGPVTAVPRKKVELAYAVVSEGPAGSPVPERRRYSFVPLRKILAVRRPGALGER